MHASRFARRGIAAALVALLACARGGLDSPDPERRARAVRALADGTGDVEGALLVAQRDPSPLVRQAAADVLAGRPGQRSAQALGALLADGDAEVVATAARGLASMPSERRVKQDLLAAYAGAPPVGRAAIADALEKVGTSLREAVELEAHRLWERNLVAADAPAGDARAGAVEELGASARSEAVQRLVPLLDPKRNPDPAIAAAAARGLAEAGDWVARPHLEALLADPRADVAEAAAQALGTLGDPAAADALAAAAAQGPARLAGSAVEALSALPQAPDVGVALCEVAARTLDPVVAARAARQARLREAECPERLFVARIGRPGADPAAIAALGEIGLAGPGAEAGASRLLSSLEAGRIEPALRAPALRALGRIGWAGAAPAIARRATAMEARIAEARARWIPGRLPSAPARAFDGGSLDARVAAAVARDPASVIAPADPAAAPDVPGWVDRVAPADGEELGAAVAALGMLRADGAGALAARLARDPLPAVRAGAAEALGALAQDAGLPVLAADLDDPAPEVRLAAAQGLAHLRARGVPALAGAAGRAPPDDLEWRVALAQALAESGAQEAVPALASLLDGAAGPEAARALGRLGAPEGAKPLAELLARPGGPAEVDAIDALAQLTTAASAPVIAAHLTSDRAEVRAAAARALGRLRYEPASPRIEALRSDYYGRVRRAAVEALSKLPSGAPRHP